MVSIWVFLLLLALPSLFVRAIILHRGAWCGASAYLACITGACQDFFVAFEQLSLFAVCQLLFSPCCPFLYVIVTCLGLLIQLYIIFDAFLHRKNSIRMEIPFFSLVNDVRHFWDSAKEKRIWNFIPGALLCALIHCFAYFFYWNHLKGASLSLGWVQCGLMMGGIGLLGFALLPKKLSYATDHILFQHQVWCVKKIMELFKKKPEQTRFNSFVESSLTPQNETNSYLSSDYPLYKYTHSFRGSKACHLRIDEKEKPHLIFIFLESFRAKDVGCLGGKHHITPHFDALASEGILFSNFYANSVRTSRSAFSSLFGIPSDTDASERSVRFDTPLIGMPQLMKQRGYQCSYIHNGSTQFENQAAFFKNHGYEHVLGSKDILHQFPHANQTSWGLPDEYLMQYSVKWLKKRETRPQFLTLFTITNHHPWNLPKHHQGPPLPQGLDNIYQKYLHTFHYSDTVLGQLVHLLQRENLLKKSILFILGDHGYPMGEHDKNFFEQRYLYEENIRVPLLIYAKGRISSPQILDQPSTQIDLVPTVMDLFSMKGFNHAVGSSLLRRAKNRFIFFHNPYVFQNFGCRIDHHKFIYTHLSREIELYNLENDPEETENIANDFPHIAGKCLDQVKNYQEFFRRIYREKNLMPNRDKTPSWRARRPFYCGLSISR